MKTITVPSDWGNPVVVEINTGEKVVLEAGATIDVEDEVASIIENALANKPKAGKGENVSKIVETKFYNFCEYNPSDAFYVIDNGNSIDFVISLKMFDKDGHGKTPLYKTKYPIFDYNLEDDCYYASLRCKNTFGSVYFVNKEFDMDEEWDIESMVNDIANEVGATIISIHNNDGFAGTIERVYSIRGFEPDESVAELVGLYRLMLKTSKFKYITLVSTVYEANEAEDNYNGLLECFYRKFFDIASSGIDYKEAMVKYPCFCMEINTTDGSASISVAEKEFVATNEMILENGYKMTLFNKLEETESHYGNLLNALRVTSLTSYGFNISQLQDTTDMVIYYANINDFYKDAQASFINVEEILK